MLPVVYHESQEFTWITMTVILLSDAQFTVVIVLWQKKFLFINLKLFIVTCTWYNEIIILLVSLQQHGHEKQ